MNTSILNIYKKIALTQINSIIVHKTNYSVLVVWILSHCANAHLLFLM